MSNSENRTTIVNSFSTTNYLAATLHKPKSGWYIEYYVEHPQTRELVRKRVRLKRLLSRYDKKTDAMAQINQIILTLNMKLASGWNPLFSTDVSLYYTKLSDVVEVYKTSIEKTVRVDTYRSYCSFVKIFSAWILKQYPDIYCSMISRVMVVRFMDYILYEREKETKRKISTTTYNNYVKLGSAFFNWLVQHCYCSENHFDFIKLKKKEKKKRVLISSDVRQKISEYLEKNNPQYLFVLELVFSCLLRPKEIRMLQVSDIDLKSRLIRVRPEVAKNGHERYIPMIDNVFKKFKQLRLENYSDNCFIFGKDMQVSSVQLYASCFRKTWIKLRETLKLPPTMQMYSFRDSGITEMLKSGVDPLSVKQFADHHSLEMTTIYSNHVDPNLSKIIQEKAPKF